MLGDSDLVAFVGTADPVRARAFYERTLGLRLLEESAFACAFQAGATALRVTVVEHVLPAPYTVLGWRVSDIAETAAALGAAGVRLLRFDGLEQDERGVWTAPGGARIAWFRDPDGNVLSVAEMTS